MAGAETQMVGVTSELSASEEIQVPEVAPAEAFILEEVAGTQIQVPKLTSEEMASTQIQVS